MMKNKSKICLLVCMLFVLMTQSMLLYAGKKDGREYYQLTIYHYNNTMQEDAIDSYLKENLLPALHKADIKQVGVFKWLGNDTAKDKKIYVLIPLSSLVSLEKLPGKNDFIAAAGDLSKKYFEAAYDQPPYNRMETVIMYAFSMAPKMQVPKLSSSFSERVYELRSYESATEKLHINKVHMFNEGGEVDLFKRLNFNAVFYATVLAGGNMPNLVYMTSFENMADRNEHWKAFSDDPVWKKISVMPEYQHNVSLNDTKFLRPASYSDY